MLPPSCQQNVHLKTCLISNWQIPSRHSPRSDNTICFATIPFCRLICIFKRTYKGAVLASLRVQLTGHCVSTPSIGSAVVSEIRQQCNDATSIGNNTARAYSIHCIECIHCPLYKIYILNNHVTCKPKV